MYKTALITGASRGLGLALARALARRGWRLLIDARGAAPLEGRTLPKALAELAEAADLPVAFTVVGRGQPLPPTSKPAYTA
jgi:NAD(P)-dependent dehydrogenase (short-subunit alcohol dehydrogenase family)